MPRAYISCLSISLFLAGVGPALAANGQTTATSNLLAGPGADKAVIVEVPEGTRLTNFGCVNIEEYCWVRFGEHRGWINGDHISRVRPSGKTAYAAFVQPEPEPDDFLYEDEYIYGAAGYAAGDPRLRKRRHARRKGEMRARFRDRPRRITRVGSKRYFKVKPRGFLKVKPRGFLRVKPRFFKLGI